MVWALVDLEQPTLQELLTIKSDDNGRTDAFMAMIRERHRNQESRIVQSPCLNYAVMS